MAKDTKGTDAVKTVTTVAQASTVALGKATSALKSIVSELVDANNTYESLVQNIELKQADLEKLDVTFNEKEREMKANLALKAKENEAILVKEILESQGKMSVTKEEYNNITKELAAVKADYDKNMKAEVAKAVEVIASRHQSELKQVSLQQAADVASMKAAIENANDKAATLQTQVEDYKTQITEERKARIEEAKARGGERVTVNTQK
jgi:predicted  nucleic acid-binding Zn-ribbon protein